MPQQGVALFRQKRLQRDVAPLRLGVNPGKPGVELVDSVALIVEVLEPAAE